MTSPATAPVQMVELSTESRWSTALELARQRAAGTLHGPLYRVVQTVLSPLPADEADEAFELICRQVDEPFDDDYDELLACAVWGFLHGAARPCVACRRDRGLGPKCDEARPGALLCADHQEAQDWLTDPRRAAFQP